MMMVMNVFNLFYQLSCPKEWGKIIQVRILNDKMGNIILNLQIKTGVVSVQSNYLVWNMENLFLYLHHQ